ncbi:MAG: c-type cytochrome domain-containing protein [Verrucomicrobiales bacterium]
MQKTILIATLSGLALPLFTTQAEDKIDFESQIWPMIENSCLKCHRAPYEDERGRTRRPKADLVVSTKEGLMAGGEDGEVIVPGKPEDSPFLQMTLLPLSDDEHMPPEDKADQWTDEEKKLMEEWIKQGADFGDWEEAEIEEE